MGVDLKHCLKMQTVLVCDKEGPNKSIHCLEYGTSHSGYKIPCYLPEQDRPESKCGLLAEYFFQMYGWLCCFMIGKSFSNVVDSVKIRRWGLRVLQVECLHVHGLTPLNLVCQQALELFLPVIIRRGREGVQSQQSAAVLLGLAFSCCD